MRPQLSRPQSSRPQSSRPLTRATLAVGATLVLVACGASDDSTDSGETGDATSQEPATRTISDTMLGDVADVPEEPERVVALWRTGAELADLGVVPVGQLDGELLVDELGEELYEQVADVPTVGTFEGVDVEEVIALEPDLIIGMDNGGLSLDYEELQQVAPTVIFEIAEPPDVWANYPRVADAVGLQTDFEERDEQLDADLAAVAEEHGDVVGDLQVTSLGAFESTIYVDTSKSLTWERLDKAGFGYNTEYSENPERYSEELSLENLPSLADQDILFYDATLDGEPTPSTGDVLESESFQRLPAAQAGNVFPLTSGTNYTFAAASKQVEDLRAAAEAYEASQEGDQ